MNVSKEDWSTAASAWQLEFFRLIAFPAEPQFFRAQHWWQDLAGGQPDDFVSTRKKQAQEDRGSFQEVILSLRVDFNRVEWLIQPRGEYGESGKLPTLGPLREQVDRFVDLLSPWLANSCPPLVRLAFVGKALQAVATDQEAYAVLSAHLPAVNFDPNPNDFFFQINRRRNSTVVPGLPLNRISSWSKMNAGISLTPPSGIPFESKWPSSRYSAVELDINTAPERSEILPQESLTLLFRELASLAVEIAQRGDIP